MIYIVFSVLLVPLFSICYTLYVLECILFSYNIVSHHHQFCLNKCKKREGILSFPRTLIVKETTQTLL